MVFPQELTMDNKSNDDCYFYYYSSCTKGDECPFRHCQLALGTETVCSLWKEGRCFRGNCKFRHMESRIDRKSIPCYWENQPGGCRKPHCVFFHRKLKTATLVKNENLGLILPVIPVSPAPVNVSGVNPENSPVLNNSRADVALDETDEGIHSPVEPFVVSFDEIEESDSESVSSTPVKVNEVKSSNTSNGKNKLLSLSENSAQKTLEFEVKTLEQIRLEKIHKQSDIYKTDDLPACGIGNFFHEVKQKSSLPSESIFNYSDYQVPSLEEYKLKRVLGAEQSYPPLSEFIALQPEKSLGDDTAPVQKKGATEGTLKKDNDLRRFLNQPPKKFAQVNISKDEVSLRKTVNLKKQSQQTEGPLDFKIKTLAEIRKERKLKSEALVQENDMETANGETLTSCKENKRTSPPRLRTFKIRRLIESTLKPSFNKIVPEECIENESRSEMDAQSMPEEQVSVISQSEDKVSLTKGKRKSSIVEEGGNAKILKMDTLETNVDLHRVSNQEKQGTNPNKQPVGNLLPFLRRKMGRSDIKARSPKQTNDETASIHSVCESNNVKNAQSSVVVVKEELSVHPLQINSVSSMDSSCHETEADSSAGVQENNRGDSAELPALINTEVSEPCTKTSLQCVTLKESAANRSLSMDDIDHFLKDTDVDMDNLEETMDGGEDDIMLKINEFLDS